MVTVGGLLTKTQKKVKKDSESLDVCTTYKHEKHPEKRKKNSNLKNTKYENVNWWGPSFYI